MFWGCPALRAGRAVSQLAGLLGPARLLAARSAAFGGPAAHPSASRCAPRRALRALPHWTKTKKPNLIRG
nr:hypothetical protein [Saprospira grandis]